MKILFMGTPEFAVPSLNALLGAGHTVCGVFTQPDKPKNRGMKLLPSPVKVCALSHEIPVFQPAKMRDGEALGYLRELDPELIVVAAYGKILPSEILDYPVKGCINVHSSLLPKYRGAAPINWAILNGEAVTGVTIMHMAPALDAGDIIAQVSTPIGADETAPTLTARLAELGAELLVSAVEAIGAGTAARTSQDEADSTYAPMLSTSCLPWTGANRPGRSTTRSGACCPGPLRWRSSAASAVKSFPLTFPSKPPMLPPAPSWRRGSGGSTLPAAVARCSTSTSSRLMAENG